MILQTKNLTYTYNPNAPFEKTAISDISIGVEKGEFVGIIGHTGSGKSTLVQMCNGLIKPTSGKIFINGEDIWEKPKEIRKYHFMVGLVFQYPEHQLFMNTVYNDIAFGPKNKGMTETQIHDAVMRSAEFVELKPTLLDKSPFELSGGEKRRAAIAGVLAMEPEVLILDEPTAGLDPYGRDTILSSIKNFQKRSGTTVLLVSHSMEDIAKLASKVLVLDHGKEHLYDTTQNVFAQSDKLESSGLAVPQITKIFMALKQKGYNVNTNIFSVQDGVNELLKLRKGGDPHA